MRLTKLATPFETACSAAERLAEHAAGYKTADDPLYWRGYGCEPRELSRARWSALTTLRYHYDHYDDHDGWAIEGAIAEYREATRGVEIIAKHRSDPIPESQLRSRWVEAGDSPGGRAQYARRRFWANLCPR